jgi:hypothetical protein
MLVNGKRHFFVGKAWIDDFVGLLAYTLLNQRIQYGVLKFGYLGHTKKM